MRIHYDTKSDCLTYVMQDYDIAIHKEKDNVITKYDASTGEVVGYAIYDFKKWCKDLNAARKKFSGLVGFDLDVALESLI